MSELSTPFLNHPLDARAPFFDPVNTVFLVEAAEEFDAGAACGALRWSRHGWKARTAFNQAESRLVPTPIYEFPPDYTESPVTPFRLEFVSPHCVRLRMATRATFRPEGESLMLAGPVPSDSSWVCEEVEGGVKYSSEAGGVFVERDPWRLRFLDTQGHVLTETHRFAENMGLVKESGPPCGVVRKISDATRLPVISLGLYPGEKVFGYGESFTRLDKRGQKIQLFTADAHGVETGAMYKPVPFCMSSRGYGLFLHTSAPVTADVGHGYDAVHAIHSADDEVDLFFFFGDPEKVLGEYTALTGRSARPPLWSFGLWMSRITYKSEEETRAVAKRLREEKIPCDVIHLDTGWFEKDWRCDYRFSKNRFADAETMIADLRKDGFKISLWQLPYITPNNPLYEEILAKGLAVRDATGNPPTEDAIIDFSNPEAVAWYQALLKRLLKMGVGAIKVDFGEGAPVAGHYASGTTGLFEHNLYPLRYNKAVADITKETTGEAIMWARSAWAGSQRYPLHWGGDAENSDAGMLASLRGGLSLGLSGFSFWSNDIGGFVHKSPEELYTRWLGFGILTSHSRCHGAPPREPWEYSAEFNETFRKSFELRYRLMPYIWAQATDSAARGLPMIRPLFMKYICDEGAWLVEDAYLFGNDLYVAPLFNQGATSRSVYLPTGDDWVDFQTGSIYPGGRWHRIDAGVIPVVLLARVGAVIPTVAPALHTGAIDWTQQTLCTIGGTAGTALVCLPEDEEVKTITVKDSVVTEDPTEGRVTWTTSVLG